MHEITKQIYIYELTFFFPLGHYVPHGSKSPQKC